MSIDAHAVLESMLITMLALGIGVGLARFREHSGYGFLWLAAFCSAWLDSDHGWAPIVDPSLMDLWVPLTWAVSGALKAVFFIAAQFMLRYQVHESPELLAVPFVLVAAFPLVLARLSQTHPELVYTGSLRHFDVVICLLFIFAAVVSPRGSLAPPTVCLLFAATHGVIGFSGQSGDGMFLLAHGLKLTAFMWWALVIATRLRKADV